MANGHTIRNRKYRYKLRRRIMLFLGYKQNLQYRDGLGVRCADCWREGKLNKRRLEFDHVNGRQWRWDQVIQFRRLRLIADEALEGKIEPVCRKHNMQRHHTGKWNQEGIESIPF